MLWKEGFGAVTAKLLVPGVLLELWHIEEKHWEDDAAAHCIVNRFVGGKKISILPQLNFQEKNVGRMMASTAADAYLCAASACTYAALNAQLQSVGEYTVDAGVWCRKSGKMCAECK